eukprot:scaffold13329_cov209-Alexandrium_tamarense.AAC.23
MGETRYAVQCFPRLDLYFCKLLWWCTSSSSPALKIWIFGGLLFESGKKSPPSRAKGGDVGNVGRLLCYAPNALDPNAFECAQMILFSKRIWNVRALLYALASPVSFPCRLASWYYFLVTPTTHS